MEKTIVIKRTKVDIQEKLNEPYTLLLLNDDYNTIEHVIECMIKIMKFDPTRAENVAFMVHTTGDCDIKWGDLETVSKYMGLLENKGLNCDIRKN